MYDHLHPTETMQRITRKELGDRLDEILEIVSRDNVGFVITDAGKDDLVLCPASWLSPLTSEGFGCIDSKELNRLITDCYLKRTVAEPPLRCSHVNLSDAEKIDVYEQVRLNWDEFVDYVWSFSKSATKR